MRSGVREARRFFPQLVAREQPGALAVALCQSDREFQDNPCFFASMQTPAPFDRGRF